MNLLQSITLSMYEPITINYFKDIQMYYNKLL